MKFCHGPAHGYQSRGLPGADGLADGNRIGQMRLRGNLLASDLERSPVQLGRHGAP
jgi:hypothetical protein